jgi:ribosomal protein S1
LNSSAVVSLSIKNLDDAPAANFEVKYSVNGGAWVVENVTTPIPARTVYTHNFSTTADLSAVGEYKIIAVVKNAATDVVAVNDTVTVVVKQLDNQPL